MWINLGITTVAVLLSPLIALGVQKKLEAFREKKQRRLDIFKTLMATRADITSIAHVQALNMIDVEFYEEKEIRDLRDAYREHLNTYFFCEQYPKESEKRLEYLVTLLYSMSKCLGYDFDKVSLRKGVYLPQKIYEYDPAYTEQEIAAFKARSQ